MTRTAVVLNLSIVFFAACLAWLAFVYYPKAAADFKSGEHAKRAGIVSIVNASEYSFPIQTIAYKVDRSNETGTYFVYVNGKTLDQYVANQQSARLALKTALSLEDFCNIKVVYISTERLTLPNSINGDDCR